MIVGDLYVEGVSVFPAEADVPLVIDADATLAFAVAGEGFQPVASWKTKIVQGQRAVDLIELHNGAADNLRGKAFRAFALEYLGRLFALEALDHCQYDYRFR